MIKKIQIELIAFLLLLICILFTYKVDIGVYDFFSKQSYWGGSDYLKKFFNGITLLGDSVWYFSIFVFVFLFSYLVKRTSLLTDKKYSYIKKLSFFGFSYLFLVGFLTQLLKHVIGRPRPNHSNLDGTFEFVFFTTESSFHSFPSGHSSTIIAVTIIASLMIPGLRYFFYFFGSLVALSRVVVGAHFFTDVVAGVLVAIITYKLFIFFINWKYPKLNINNLQIPYISMFFKTTIVFLGLGVLLSFGPEIDLFVSGLFYFDDNQFLLQSYFLVSVLFRKILLPLILIYIFILPLVFKFLRIERMFFGYEFTYLEILLVWLSGIFTMLLNVNILLKNMWGRARPNDILSFGGDQNFTPWYKVSDSCITNCSFVSGDASVGFFLIIFYFITFKNIYLYLAVFFGSVLGLIRIVAGGHFFSDIIFSQIVVTLSVFASYYLYKKTYVK